MFVDVDGDGVVSEGDEQVGVTDKDGKFSAPADAPSGALLAVGGVNTDTGVPNTLVLRAPSGSSVVNPLTTLVQAVIEASGGTATVESASAAVAKALGIELPEGVQLTAYDPIEQNDVAAQRVAAQVATLASLAAESGDAVIDSLAEKVREVASAPQPQTLELDQPDTVAALLSAVEGGVGEELQAQIVAAMQQIATAESLDAISNAQSKVLDTVAPAAPETALDPASDLGASATDRLTSDATPSARVKLDTRSVDGAAAVAGDTLVLSIDGEDPVEYVLTAADLAAGEVIIALPALADGPRQIVATLTDRGGNRAESVALEIVIDTATPTVQTVTASDPLLTDADLGAGKQTFVVRFSEAMDKTVAPTLSFGADVSSTLSNPVGSWNEAGTVYTVTYTVADGGVEVKDVTVDVSGARDAAGNSQAEYAPVATFGIDTRAPDLPLRVGPAIFNTGSPVVEVTAEPGLDLRLGSGGAWVDPAAYAVSESAEVPGQYTIQVLRPEGLPDGGYGIVATDAAGNVSMPPAGQPGPGTFRIDTQAPQLASVEALRGEDGRYDEGDRIRLRFSEPIRVPELQADGTLTVLSGVLGEGWTLEPVEPREGLARSIDIVLGAGAELTAFSRLQIAPGAVIDVAGNVGATGLDLRVPGFALSFELYYGGRTFQIESEELAGYYPPSYNDFEVSRFYTATMILRSPDQPSVLRVLDLETGEVLAGRDLLPGEVLLPSKGKDTFFHTLQPDAETGELVIRTFGYGLDVDGTALDSALGELRVSPPETGDGIWNPYFNQYIPQGLNGEPGFVSAWVWDGQSGQTRLYRIDGGPLIEVALPDDMNPTAWLGNAFVFDGALWVETYDGGSRYYALDAQGNWTAIEDEDQFWSLQDYVIGWGSVVRDGTLAIDLLDLVPDTVTAAVFDAEQVTHLPDGALLIRAEVFGLDDAIDHELWAVFKDGVEVASKVFDTATGFGLRSVYDTEADAIYFQHLNVTIGADGTLSQGADALVLYRIALQEVVAVLQGAAALDTLAGAEGVETVVEYSQSQLAGGVLAPGEIVLMLAYISAQQFADAGDGGIVLTELYDSNEDSSTLYLSRILADGTVLGAHLLPEEIMGIVLDPLNGLFLQTETDDRGASYAFHLDVGSGQLTAISLGTYAAVERNGGVPEGVDFLAGTDAADTFDRSAETAGQWLAGGRGDDTLKGGSADDRLIGGDGADHLYGNEGDDLLIGMGGDDRLRGGLGADSVYGGSGTDRVRYFDPAELEGDRVTGASDFWDGDPETLAAGADRGTLDRIQLFGAGSYDFHEAGVDYIDRVDLAPNTSGEGAGIEVILSAQLAASADANSDGFFGDLRVVGYDGASTASNPPATTVGLIVDASALTAQQSLVVQGEDGSGVTNPLQAFGGMAGDDSIHGGRGNDYIASGRGDDTLIGGAGDDILIGGDGVDVASFQGQEDEYDFERAEDGALLVFDTEPGRDGAERLYGIEWLEFSDGRQAAQEVIQTLIA